MSSLHYFNPGHEAAVVTRSPYYMPPANVARMAVDLAAVPAWYAEEGDYYLVSEVVTPGFFSQFPPSLRPPAQPLTAAMLASGRKLPGELTAEPWGLSLQSLSLFEQLAAVTPVSLHLPEWNEAYPELVGRQSAARCLSRLRELVPHFDLPRPALFCSSVEEVEQYLLCHENRNLHVLKLPYSSSGRGLHWMESGKLTPKDRQWISGGIRRQGAVSIEPVLTKQNDYALEFYSNGNGTVRYEGFSSFLTNSKGAYQGNLLNAHRAEEEMYRKLPEGAARSLTAAIEQVVTEVYGSAYCGYLGVDMLTYTSETDKKPALYPFVEVNLRHTFGLVAHRISQRLIAPGATGSVEVIYNPIPGALCRFHQEMLCRHPIEREAHRLCAGYLPLSPVVPQSAYMAYLLVK